MSIARILALAAIACLGLAPTLAAQDPPAVTQKMLSRLKLQPSILDGLDKELTVPASWMEEAKREKALRISGSWDHDQFRRMVAAFEERYPFVKLTYARGSRQERVVTPLVAFQSGRYTVDLISGLGASFTAYREAGALADMRDIPNFNNVPVGMRDEGGLWVGERLRYWCMTYNTKLVARENLPKTWDDLLTNPIWRNGRLALSDRPNLWLANVWVLPGYGDEWGKQYLNRLFNEVKPQMRKEGNNSLVVLVVGGEFNGAVPSADYRAMQYLEKGAPIGWHCPEPVPLAISELGIMKGNPNFYASKLWVNWFLSKEGQIAQYDADRAPPVHKDLQTHDFLPFSEEVVGRKVAFREPGVVELALPRIFETWNSMWQSAASGSGK
jgi:ABC-type Fe3+ transport system substrate-binding protein